MRKASLMAETFLMGATLIDLTQPVDWKVPVYPGDPPFSSQQFCSVDKDGYSVHALSCSSHVGTHIDAPSHFIADGATIDQLLPSAFILPALVLDVSHKKDRECISWDSVEPVADRICPGTAVLFHTGWSRHWDDATRYFDHPWLAADVAERLVALGARLIGTDTMSPDQSPMVGPSAGDGDCAPDFGVHRTILGAGGLIVENLTNLDSLLGTGPDTEVIVSVLPLRIAGCDGSPVRAVAWLQSRGGGSLFVT
ncbi:putative cyclase [Lactarius akahatsu]|uniref:Cyclase n=1 Tax=Lactarius akahatsu TaxID=416441 RepID=A0AAD4LKX6_9AGAM|nr:putative cyclase [Lactarius akahatsu]